MTLPTIHGFGFSVTILQRSVMICTAKFVMFVRDDGKVGTFTYEELGF